MGFQLSKLNYNLNLIIKRKNYNEFIRNGGNMNFRISEELSSKAKQIIEDDEIKEGLEKLKSQIKSLSTTSEDLKVYDSTEVEDATSQLENIQKSKDSLNFKRESLSGMLSEKYSRFDIMGSVELKEQLDKINLDIESLAEKEKIYNDIILSDQSKYQEQMQEIKDKYDSVDVLGDGVDFPGFSKSVVNDYKRERVSKLVTQFLETLPEDKKGQVLAESEDLKGYINVGENT